MKNRPIRTLILAVVVACGLSLTACSTEKKLPAVPVVGETTIGLTFIPNIQFAPFYVADSHGFYSDEVSATLRHHGAGEGLFTALAAGEEDFVVAGGDEILQARTQGIDIVAVASYYSQYPVRFIVPQDSTITSVEDLKGHSIGLPGRFGENWFALLIALDQAGLKQTDVTIVEIGYTHQVALTTGEVDVVVGFANSDVLNFETAGFPVSVIDPEVPLVSICLATTSTYAEEHPQIVTGVVAGMTAAMESVINDPEGTLTIATDYIPSFRGDTLEAARVVLPATSALFTNNEGAVSPPLDAEQWTRMAEAMVAVGLIEEEIDPSEAFTNQFNH
ncbi:MAG: ABC transporter substrate-binding protein [Propionibacteriaceae bacterium]|jgi:NitT/TauT family transport system substrate-binding protein|nr:ABC transporter substrate-binding protein [Propionibacteriaceae bacterium]